MPETRQRQRADISPGRHRNVSNGRRRGRERRANSSNNSRTERRFRGRRSSELMNELLQQVAGSALDSAGNNIASFSRNDESSGEESENSSENTSIEFDNDNSSSSDEEMSADEVISVGDSEAEDESAIFVDEHDTGNVDSSRYIGERGRNENQSHLELNRQTSNSRRDRNSANDTNQVLNAETDSDESTSRRNLSDNDNNDDGSNNSDIEEVSSIKPKELSNSQCEDDDEEEPTCPICMDVLEGKLGVTNPCGHLFHQECYGSWDAQCRAKFGYKGTKCPSCNTRTSNFVHLFVNLGKVRNKIVGTSLQSPSLGDTARMHHLHKEEMVKLKADNRDLKLQVESLSSKLETSEEASSRFEIQLFQQRLETGKQTQSIEALQKQVDESNSTIISLKSDLVEEERKTERIRKTMTEKIQNMSSNPELNVIKRQVERMKQRIESQQTIISEMEDEKAISNMKIARLKKMVSTANSPSKRALEGKCPLAFQNTRNVQRIARTSNESSSPKGTKSKRTLAVSLETSKRREVLPEAQQQRPRRSALDILSSSNRNVNDSHVAISECRLPVRQSPNKYSFFHRQQHEKTRQESVTRSRSKSNSKRRKAPPTNRALDILNNTPSLSSSLRIDPF